MRPFVPSLGCCVYLELVTWEALLTQGHSADILARTWLTIVKTFTLFHIFIKSIYQPYQVLVFVRGVNSYNCNLLNVQRLLKSLKGYIVCFTATVLCLKLIAMKIKAFLHDFLCNLIYMLILSNTVDQEDKIRVLFSLQYNLQST